MGGQAYLLTVRWSRGTHPSNLKQSQPGYWVVVQIVNGTLLVAVVDMLTEADQDVENMEEVQADILDW